MKPYVPILAILCLCFVYLNQETPKSTPEPSAPSPATDILLEKSSGKPSEIPDQPLADLSDSGYCGAALPAGFQRPGISVLLNKAPGIHGNTARGIYNRQGDLEAHLDTWQEQAPESPYPHIWRGFLSLKNHRQVLALEHLQQAYTLLPANPILALMIGNIQAHTHELQSAIKMLKIYMTSYPQDLPKQQELARLETQYEIQERYLRIQYDGLNLLYPPETSQLDWDTFLEWMSEELDAAAEFTGTPKREALTVVAFEGKAELLATTCTPTWTGGVYDGSIKLALRNLKSLPSKTTAAHETLHAQLSHALMRPIPAWFSEGMAQAFAREEIYARRSWQKMVQHQTYIPFSSLGASFLEFKGSEDARLAYHQGLAMVLWIQELEGEDGIHRLVQLLKSSKSGQRDLMQEIQESYDTSDFLEFVATLLQD